MEREVTGRTPSTSRVVTRKRTEERRSRRRMDSRILLLRAGLAREQLSLHYVLICNIYSSSRWLLHIHNHIQCYIYSESNLAKDFYRIVFFCLKGLN